MKRLQPFEGFKMNEAKTLFGDTAEEKLKKIKVWAEDLGFKTSNSINSIPPEVADMWPASAKEKEKGQSKTKGLTIWGKWGEGMKDPKEIVELIGALIIDGSNPQEKKSWEKSTVKMVDGRYTKKSLNRAQAFSHPANGSIMVQVKPMNDIGSRLRNENDWIAFVMVTNDKTEYGYSGKISKEDAAKVDDIFKGKTPDEKEAILNYAKVRHAKSSY